MKNIVIETIVYELLKEEHKISPENLLSKTTSIYNNTVGGTLNIDEYNEIVSGLKVYRYLQRYRPIEN